MQSWFTQYYAPIETPTSAPNSVIDPTEKDYSETYTIFSAEVTFVFVLDLYYTSPNPNPGGDALGNYYITVRESRTDSTSPSLESSSQDHIHVQDINITVKSSPYIIFTSLQPYRQNINNYNGFIGLDFSVSLSFGTGPFSASISPTFTDKTSTNGELVPLSRYNKNEQGVRIVECGQLPKNYYLAHEGDCYGMQLQYMDAKASGEYTGVLEIEFEYYINNGYYPPDSLEEMYSIDVGIYVQ